MVALFTLESYLFSHIHSSMPFSEGVAQKSWPMLSTIHLPIMFMKWPFITVERIFPRKCQSILCVSYLILHTHILKQLQLSHWRHVNTTTPNTPPLPRCLNKLCKTLAKNYHFTAVYYEEMIYVYFQCKLGVIHLP